MLRRIGEMASRAKEYLLPTPIHPDFTNRWVVKDSEGRDFVWWGKGEWGVRPQPTHKIGFSFDDIHQLDGMPEGFVAKIGPHANGTNKYFGLIYGYEADIEEIKKWMEGRQLFRPKLMKNDGTPIADI